MNRKDAPAIVEPDDSVHIAPREQHPPQGGAAAIDRKAAGQHQTEAAPRARQFERALDEELIPVRVAVGLRGVSARFAGEAHDGGHVGARRVPAVAGTSVGPQHVPRRVADHRVEAAVRPPDPGAVEKHFRELELPMKEAAPRGNPFRRIEIGGGGSGRQRAGT